MSLIEPQRKIERQALTIKFDAPVLAALRAYAKFISSAQEYVVNHALLYLFENDHEFASWCQAAQGEARILDDLATLRLSGTRRPAARARRETPRVSQSE